MSDLTVYHIPVCPFSQRLEILLSLKGKQNSVNFHAVDITQPRPDWLLEKTGNTTTLPILETADGHIIKESLVLMQYLEDIFPERAVAQPDPYKHAIESMLTRMEGEFVNQGYVYLMNQDITRRDDLKKNMLRQFVKLNDFLMEHSTNDLFLFDDYGWAEAVFTPLFMRFWFLEYYEEFQLPMEDRYARVHKWREACISHPAAKQVTKEQIVKLYYDYALGAGNGALLPGRRQSSFVFEPDWDSRPWPPKNKYDYRATDEELGLC
jgi:glutathione S-transferase